MKKIASVLILLLGFSATDVAHGQLSVEDSSDTWQREVTGRISFAQTGFQNWQEGGINSLAISSGANARFRHTRGVWDQDHDIRLSIGFVKQDSLTVRKAEDLIQIVSAITYEGNGFLQRFQPTFSSRFRSQFAGGWDYSGSSPQKVSAFLAPASLTQSAGLTYTWTRYARQRVGVGLKETIVTVEALRERYGVDRDHNTRLEAGLTTTADIDHEIFRNVHVKSSLSLFASFNKPENPDAIWEILIRMKVNTWLNVNFEHLAVYDTDISRALQMKVVFLISFSFIVW